VVNPTLEKAGFRSVVYIHKPIYNNDRQTAMLTTIYAMKDGKTHKVSEQHEPDQVTNAKKRLHKQLCLA